MSLSVLRTSTPRSQTLFKSLITSFKRSQSLPIVLDSYSSTATTITTSWSLRTETSLLAGLIDLLPPILWAVPKSKTSHSKKSMRSSGKGLKERTNMVSCPSCGQPKPSHTICHECHVAFRKEIHAEAKERLRSQSS